MLIKDKIKNRDWFTPTENQIAEYMTKHTKEVIDLPLEDLARNLYVSKSTIIRFCKKLGFRGHKELCVQLAREINSFLIDESFDGNGLAPFCRDDGPQEIAQRVFSLNYQALSSTFSDLNLEALQNAAELISAHHRLRFYAIGEDYQVALDLVSKLQMIGFDAEVSNVLGMQELQAAVQNLAGAAVIVCYSGRSDVLRRVAEILHDRMIPIVLLTGPRKGYLLNYAGIVLQTSFAEEESRIGPIGSRTGMFLMADILYSLIFHLDYDTNAAQLKSIDQVLAKSR